MPLAAGRGHADQSQVGSSGSGAELIRSSPGPRPLSQTASFATAPTPVGGNFTIDINGTSVTIPATAAVDDGTGTSVVGLINAQTANDGVTASYDAKTQKITLSSGQEMLIRVTGR